MGRPSRRRRRAPLDRPRVVDAAVALADAGGLAALSMRRLADALRVEAMSLYHHVAGKEEVLDGMVDAVFAEIALPSPGQGWRAAMRDRARSARAALSRHPWAIGLLDSRPHPGPATLRHHDAVVGALRKAGFSVAMAAHAFSVIDSYLYGFTLQELSLPFRGREELEEVTGAIMRRIPAGEHPHLAELARELVMKPGYAYACEFEYGLELVLEGLERRREGRRRAAGARRPQAPSSPR